MAILVKNIRGNNVVEFDKVSFDEWCVFLKRPNKLRYPPVDTEYFSILKKLSNVYTSKKIYDDFIQIYTPTNSQINPEILNTITSIADTYGNDSEELDIWFTVIYAGMIAEENKQFAILKKRIKRLGIYQVLIDSLEPKDAANFSKGKKWRDLDVLMKTKGF